MLLGIAMLFSCQNQAPKYQQNKYVKFPLGEAQNFELVYTDSTRVKAILKSRKNLDFSNQKFPYMEFPEGLLLELFNDQKQKSTIESNYGIYYPKTRLIELRDSVRITTHEGKVLKTNQLFYYEASDWVFTEQAFSFADKSKGSLTKGIGMDFDKSFTQLKAHKITGIMPIKE